MVIRKKELKDCKVWVDINIKSWNDNLKGIVSDKLLKKITDSRNLRIEKDINNFKIDDWHYVLEENNNIIGIMKLRKSDRKDYENCGEVQILYLNTDQKGKGYGKVLLEKAFEVLKEKGYEKVVIGCLDGNPSNDFYIHLGGKFIRQDYWKVFDESYVENIYEYIL